MKKKVSTEGQLIAKARDVWFRTDDGCKCRDGSARGIYLENRLELAFLAGIETGKKLKQKAGN